MKQREDGSSQDSSWGTTVRLGKLAAASSESVLSIVRDRSQRRLRITPAVIVVVLSMLLLMGAVNTVTLPVADSSQAGTGAQVIPVTQPSSPTPQPGGTEKEDSMQNSQSAAGSGQNNNKDGAAATNNTNAAININNDTITTTINGDTQTVPAGQSVDRSATINNDGTTTELHMSAESSTSSTDGGSNSQHVHLQVNSNSSGGAQTP